MLDASTLLPQVLSVARPNDSSLVIRLAVPASLPCFADHFAAFPMLPGVLQLGWAVQLAQQYLVRAAPFSAVTQLKFQQPIEPDADLSLQLQHEPDGRVSFRYSTPAGLCSAGRLSFGASA